MSDTLTLDEIDVLLSETKTRGEYKPVLTNFFATEGEDGISLNVSKRFPGKDAQSLRNSVNIRLKQDFPTENYKLMVVGTSVEKGGEGQAVLLVNMTKYLAAVAAKAAASEQAEVEPTNENE